MARKPKAYPDKIMLSEVEFLKAENAVLKHNAAKHALAQVAAAGNQVFNTILKAHGVGAEDDVQYQLDLLNRCMVRGQTIHAPGGVPIESNGHAKTETTDER